MLTTVYAEVSDLKAAIGQSSSSDDTELQALLLTCSRVWDGYCNRELDGFEAVQTATAREYPGRGDGWVYIDECTEVTAIGYKSVTETAYTSLATSYIRPFRGSPKSRNGVRYNTPPYHGIMLRPNAPISYFDDGQYDTDMALEPTVEVTARWGYADTAPTIIKQATITLATIFYKRGKGAWADVLMDSNFGDQRFIRTLDPALVLMVDKSGLKRPRMGLR